MQSFFRASLSKAGVDGSRAHQCRCDELVSKSALRDQTYVTALKHLKAGRGKGIEPLDGKARIYLVPGRVTDDGFVKVQSTVLITKFGNLYEVTEFQGEVVGLADLNRDGIPE